MARIIYDAHTSIRRKPKNYNEADEPLFAPAFTYEVPATNVTTLDNAVILRERIFSLRKLKFYLAYSNILRVPQAELRASFKLFLKPGQHTDKALWITHEWGHAYFHWFTDVLTRWVAVKDMVTDHVVVLPNYYKNFGFIRESLEMLGLKAFYYVPKRRLSVKHLLMPSHTAATANYNQVLINKLRDILAIAPPTAPWRKVYVSRQKATKRKIINDDAVIALMKKYNYELHYFEDYSLQQQITLMSETRSLASIHGAGLTNMLFMKDGGNILELRRENDNESHCFYALSSDLGHDYYYLNNKGTSDHTHTADLTVDLTQLEKVLVQMEP